jgi:hypothetical protein
MVMPSLTLLNGKLAVLLGHIHYISEGVIDILRGQKLVEWRVQQSDGHWEAVHRLQDALEVGALEHQQLI